MEIFPGTIEHFFQGPGNYAGANTQLCLHKPNSAEGFTFAINLGVPSLDIAVLKTNKKIEI